MTAKILKYTLPSDRGVGTIPLSAFGRVLRVGRQRNQFVIWVSDDLDKHQYNVPVRTYRTGDECADAGYYLGTATFHHMADEDYVPVPTADNRGLVALLDEMGMLERDAQGQLRGKERWLIREPEERVFADGAWHEGLFPEALATAADLAELKRFLIRHHD